MPSAEGNPRRGELDTGRANKSEPKGPARTRGKAAGRFRVLNTFVDSTLRGLRRNDLGVWLVLYRDTQPDGTANVSQGRIAERVGVTVKTVRRAITRLAGQGLVTIICRGSLRRGPTLYRVWSCPKGGRS